MAKFNSNLNADIRRTIKSFNQKIKRAEKRGEKGLPELRSVREFKQQYATEKDAKRELAQLRGLLNNKQALARHRTKEGTISNWEYDYIVKNLTDTKRWVDRELEKARLRVKDYPEHLYAIREDVLRLEDEKAYLERDIRNLTARELKTVGAIERRMKRANLKNITARKFFMQTLDNLLTTRGMRKSERKNIYSKLESLSNDEFLELYKTHDIVGTIMGYYVPADADGRVEILEDLAQDEEVEEIISDFNSNLDEYISEAKDSVKKTDLLLNKSTGQYVTKEEFKKYIKGGKW